MCIEERTEILIMINQIKKQKDKDILIEMLETHSLNRVFNAATKILEKQDYVHSDAAKAEAAYKRKKKKLLEKGKQNLQNLLKIISIKEEEERENLKKYWTGINQSYPDLSKFRTLSL